MNITQLLFISLLSSLLVNADLNPCDDFYEFACEGFIKKTPVPEEAGFVDQASLLEGDLFNKLRSILSEENSEDSHSDKLPKIFYKGCIDNDGDIEDVREILEDFHGFPVNSDWDASSYDWVQALYNMKELGLPNAFFFRMRVTLNGEKAELSISSPYVNLYVTNDTEGDPLTAAYYKYMVDAAESLGADRQTAETDMMDVLMFEYEIEKIKPYDFRYNRPEQKINTLGELVDIEPRFDWLEYVNKIVPGSDYINETQLINVYTQQYIVDMMDLIQRTDSRTLANFMNWKLVDFAFDYLNEDLRKLKPGPLTAGPVYNLDETQEKNCFRSTLIKFQDIVAKLFLKKYFTKADQQVVVEMMETMRDEVKLMVNETEWMDEETKEEAYKKLVNLKVEIGYPEEVFQGNTLKYEQLTLIPGSFLKMNLNERKFFKGLHFRRLYLPNAWDYENPMILNSILVPTPHYRRNRHFIDIPAGHLQPPIFNRSNSEEVNYGSAGFGVGREFSYAINERGSRYNYLGETENWWTDATKEAFQDISFCAINAYEDLVKEYPDEEHIFASDYLEQILADLSGAKIAYRAYQKTAEELQGENHADEDHSSNQKFWLSLANFHCAKNDLPRLQRNHIFFTEPHLPGKTRMNGIAMNNEDFARDWKCDSGSPMNPQEKCQVW